MSNITLETLTFIENRLKTLRVKDGVKIIIFNDGFYDEFSVNKKGILVISNRKLPYKKSLLGTIERLLQDKDVIAFGIDISSKSVLNYFDRNGEFILEDGDIVAYKLKDRTYKIL